MPDILTPAQRHRCMSHIRSKATKPEMAVRRIRCSEKSTRLFFGYRSSNVAHSALTFRHVGARIQVPTECTKRAGQAGHCDAVVQDGDFRQRLFLACEAKQPHRMKAGGLNEE